MLKEMLKKEINITMEYIDTHKCRFMGEVNTFDITLVDKDFKYTKSILHKSCGGAAVLPIDNEGNVFLEIQYRFPIRQAILEVPAGRNELDETFLECAKRELREETGCTSEKILQQPNNFAQPEFTDEEIGCFIAMNCAKVSEQKLDIDESVTVIKLPFEVAVEMVKRNIIIDERTMILIGEARCILGLRYDTNISNMEEYIREIQEKVISEGDILEEKDIDIDYTEVCEFGIIQDHIVKVPGDKNSRRECFYVKSGDLVLPISKDHKLGFQIRYMPSVKQNLLQLPCKLDFDRNTVFEPFGEMVTAVGYSNDRQYMYLIRDLEENDEFIWLERDSILRYIKEGVINDGRVLAAVLKYLC